MKAGGIDLVSAYTIWIHHEEVEGEWDFSGDRDLQEVSSDNKELRSSLHSEESDRGHTERFETADFGLADAEGKKKGS